VRKVGKISLHLSQDIAPDGKEQGNTGLADRSSTVQRNTANRFTSRILLSAASVAACAAACAGNFVGMAPTSRAPQIMLYVSQPLWSNGKSFRAYGLRIEEVRGLPTSLQPAAAGSLRRSVLVDLQMVPHSDIRIEFGRRLIWDFTHAAFGPQSSSSSLEIGLTIHSTRFPDPARLRPWDLRAPGLSLMTERLVPDLQAGGVSVRVAAALVTPRWTPSVGSPGTTVSGFATLLPLSRACGLWACPPSVDGFHSSSFDH
jgi:hypothetical protein